ncbi:DUF1542 domain-containing protein, partial [Streptococcus suis]|uniref:DUF1542 domain-containing protein n=2 Tax=Streptococcus suis TaxID=1307 RepID=UPI0012907852
KTLADELLKFDEDGVLTAMLDATTQAITITPSSKGAVRPDYPNHIRDFANSNQGYNGQDFFFGLIDKELTQERSQISATAQAADGSNPSISLLEGRGGQPLSTDKSFGLQINNSGVIYGTTTIKEAGNTVSWQFQAQNGSDTARKQFTFVPYTVVKTDEEPVRKAVTAGVTADEILAKVKSDVTRDDGSTRGPLNATFEEYFNSTLTARATDKSTKVAEEAKNDKQIWHEIKEYVKVAEADGTAVSGDPVTGSLPTEAGTYDVTVLSTNVHGQTIENVVKVILNAAPSMPTIGVNPNVKPNNNDPRKLEVLHVFGNVTGTTEAVSTSGSATAPDFDTTKATKSFPVTDPEKDTVTLKYGVPGYVTTYEAGNPDSFTANGRELISAETKNIGVPNTEQLLFNAEGKLTGELTLNPGQFYSRIVKMTDTAGNVSYSNPFFVVGYTDKLIDDTPVAVNQGTVLTENNIFGKLTIDTTSGSTGTNQSLTVPESEYTRAIVGYRTVDGTIKGELVEQTDLTQFPTDKDLEVKVQTTNPYGQTIYNWVKVDYNLKPKVEIVDAVGGETKTVYVFSKNNDRTENSEGVTGTNVAFDKNKATKALVNITDDGQVTAISYTDGKSAVSDLVTNDKIPNAVIDTDGFFNGDVDALAGGSVTRVVKVTDNANVVGDSPRFRIFPFSDTVPADVTPVSLFKGTSPTVADITAKMVIDSNSGYPDNSEVEIPEDAYTRTVVGYRLDSSSPTVAVDSVAGLPTEGSYQVRVKTSNAYGQEIYNWVPVSHYDRELAKADVENQAAAAKEAIDNNPNLSEDEKQTFKDAVDEAAQTAKGEIDKAKTPAEAQTAEEAGTAAIAEDVLDAAKQDAKNKIDEDVKAAKEAIDNDPNLSEDEKQTFKDAVDEAAQTAKGEIDKAKTPAEAQTAEKAGTAAIAEDVLDAAKQDAKNKIDEDVKAAKEAIDNDPNLSEDEKQTFKDAVDEAAQTAKGEIDKATTPAEAQTAEDNGVKAIDAEELKAAKQDAKNKIAADVKAANAAIESNPNLSEKEIADAKAAVADEAKKANDAIDAATTPEAVQEKEEEGTAAITADVLDAAKLDAKNKIAKDVEAANAAIESNPNLSEKEIADAKAAVADEAKKANDAIDAATTPEAVQEKEEEGTKAIAADVLDAAKLDAKNKIAKDLATVEAAIDANSNLSQDEKDAAKLAAQAKAAEAVANIEKATTPEAVQTLEDAAVKDLANIEIKAAYDDAVKAIEAADNLSTAAKTKALDDLKKARQAAEDAVKNATTADEVAKGALDGLKSIAKVEAKAAADDAKEAIAKNSNLTEAEKKVYTDAIDKALKDTETKIDAATDADTVDAETVLAQKDIAKQEVAAATADAVKGIEANTNLTDDEKAEYKANVAKAAETAEKAITDATTAADIQSKTFDATQAAAKEEVTADAADAIAGIKANDNLSDTAKEEAIAAIEKARDTTLENIENAKTAADVDAATLDAEKANAKAEIKAAADDAKKAIDENTNLPESDKNALKLAIDAEVAATNLEIDNAKTAEEIDAATLAT